MTVIVMILIASISICFGVIKNANAKNAERHLSRLDSHYIMIMELKTQSAVIEVQLTNLNTQVKELNEILRYEYNIKRSNK